MPEFNQQRNALNQTRSQFESARLNLLSVNERLKLLQRQKSALGRKKNPDNASFLEESETLNAKIEALQQESEEKQGLLNGLHADLNGILTDFAPLTDPRIQLKEHFKNSTPFILFPVRLETRFNTGTDPRSGRQIPQLWVRVYPDTCMVDAFDPQLSDQELRNAARFWAEYYAAGEIIDEDSPDPKTLDLQKAAWAFLVNLEGAGRAAWITQAEEAKPLPGSVFPSRTSDETIILTIATEDASILGDQTPIFNFFKDLWFAGKDAVQIDLIMNSRPDAQDLIDRFLPVNFYEPLPSGLKREDAEVKIALVLLPDAFDGTGKTNSWSQAARVSIMPERFVLLGYKSDALVIEQPGNLIPSPLQVGFDPNNTEANNFKLTDSGDLEIPEEVKWIMDFDKAVEQGMGFRVNLNENTSTGVDRLFVLGVRLSADETVEGGQQQLSELFDHHYYSTKGLSIIPQGTPTNNTETQSAGESGVEDSDPTFDIYFKGKPAFTPSFDWQVKKDGQWLSEWLGLDNALSQRMLNGGGYDQADALNMNLALWPGTLGYAMDAMMKPVFEESAIDLTRQFFTMFVNGRGSVPAIRIGNQPYGILPTTAFQRQRWMYPRHDPGVADRGIAMLHFKGKPTAGTVFIQQLYEILLKISSDWQTLLVPKVKHVSAESSAHTHQDLLDILGLHPNSVEFHHRYLQTLEMLYSYCILNFPFDQVKLGFDKMEFGRAYQLLIDLGYDPNNNNPQGELPLLSKLYGLDDSWEHKVIIDTVPLSEEKEIRSYTDDDKNYITALIEAASTSIDALRKNEGLSEKPSALLFLMLKFALEQGYFDTAVRLHEAAEVFTPQEAINVRAEQPFLHVQWEDKMVESRYALLYKNENSISPDSIVGDHIASMISNPAALLLISPGLAQQMDALRYLEHASTARLERAFVEHLDCCSYRLDAWHQGLIRLQLMLMRGNHSQRSDEDQPEQEVKKGIYLGAFGWLENVRPETDKILTPKNLSEELKEDFTRTYVTDEANAGYIHAPSVNQSVTAAVLRNAFLTNGKVDNNSSLAVNLSSERIRLALSVIEGIQNGQSLAALLGYKFERILHDQIHLKNKGIDNFIYALRKRFPLRANKIKDTNVENDPSVDPDTVPISAIEARNVVHGKNLIDHVKKQSDANKSYPFGFPSSKLPAADSIITTAITDAVNQIMNIEDAIADLGMAESVHQVCLGNYDRAAGVLETYSNGSYPQAPDVIRTPRSGPTLTHRVGLQLEFVSTVAYDTLHPRASAEPSLNQWLTDILPPMTKIICYCNYVDRTDDTLKKDVVTLADLGVSPLDLIYLLNNTGEQALAEIDERLLHFVYQNKTPRLDADVRLEYVTRPSDPTQFSLFEIMALVKSLRVLVLQSAHLKPTDMLLSGEASTSEEIITTLDRSRVDHVIQDLDGILDGSFTTTVLDVMNALPDAPTEPEAENMIQHVDDYLDDLATELSKLRRFGLPQTGAGDLYRRRQELIDAVQEKVRTVIDRFEKKRQEYEDLESVYDPLAEDAIAQLQKLEALVSTQYSDLDVLQLAAVQAKKAMFDTKLVGLQNTLIASTITGISVLVNNVKIQFANLDSFELEQTEIKEEEARIVRFVVDDLKPRASGVFELGKKCTVSANAALTDLDTLDPATKIQRLESAAKAIFGDEFRLIPKYTLDDQHKFELDNAWNSSDLLDYLKSTHDPPFDYPEEDWLHGVSRVREKVHHVENSIFLREALGLDEEVLTVHPMQLPFKTEDYHWMAMPFPPEVNLEEGEMLLFTSLNGSVASAPQYACGFLIDEWTEVIPLEKETTGLSFHFDRPNSEAPQTMLLVTPTKLTGNWEWQDLVDALHYTLDVARMRAVEPYHVDQTVYARYLPPLMSPVTRHPITMGMYLQDLPLKATIDF